MGKIETSKVIVLKQFKRTIKSIDINNLPKSKMLHSFIDELHKEEEDRYLNDLRLSFVGRR